MAGIMKVDKKKQSKDPVDRLEIRLLKMYLSLCFVKLFIKETVQGVLSSSTRSPLC